MPVETPLFIGESIQSKKEINHGNCKEGSGQESSSEEGRSGQEGGSCKEGSCEEGSTRQEGRSRQEGSCEEGSTRQEAHPQRCVHEGSDPQPGTRCRGRLDA